MSQESTTRWPEWLRAIYDNPSAGSRIDESKKGQSHTRIIRPKDEESHETTGLRSQAKTPRDLRDKTFVVGEE